ncbi:inactive ubiquitin carboxyl-terminal hydrolase MINDY-4B, partial [Arctopsyche grandis]|uniref:inactive ubiquitin carboxyl-terminal hydrolase MINDY-4B n=1 Tax=Arctopsyche grandis TaxID=121162 RepID=UPI00406D9FE4
VTEKVLYARSSRGPPGSRIPVSGGTPITEELAIELRQLIFGAAGCPTRGEWLRTSLGSKSWCPSSPRNTTRGLLTVVAAYSLKYLLFDNRPKDSKGKCLPTDALLHPDEKRQQEALCVAISEILWKAGEQKKCVVALPQDTVYVQHSHSYYQDSITEKLHIFEFFKVDDLEIFVKRYLYLFEEEPGAGALLLLYSLVLSRGTQSIKKDLDDRINYLVSSQVEGSLNLVMLALTGRATPYLHNGIVYVGDEDHYAMPQYGVLARSAIGLLLWRGNGEKQETEIQPPGSRLKTPASPIWVTYCMSHFGVMFNTNRELLRNYHAERRFDLHYYTCGGCQVFLTVDTRGEHEGGTALRDDINATPLEKLIHSKWQDAKVTWTGQTPYVGETAAN